MNNENSSSGQALIEWAAGLLLLIPAFLFFAWVAKTQWQQFQCAYRGFEGTRAALEGRHEEAYRLGVRIFSNEREITGVAQCGPIRQKVTLTKLR